MTEQRKGYTPEDIGETVSITFLWMVIFAIGNLLVMTARRSKRKGFEMAGYCVLGVSQTLLVFQLILPVFREQEWDFDSIMWAPWALCGFGLYIMLFIYIPFYGAWKVYKELRNRDHNAR